ncbi:mechanosensitive ion channel [Candidatus Dependentiae bacterium]|nr:mechanosensitive ion channel [Candidatus Dependentiae bacterium]MCG2756377.1 mechanosensitive ion channel [Candidatus Dependentiae bacterium]
MFKLLILLFTIFFSSNFYTPINALNSDFSKTIIKSNDITIIEKDLLKTEETKLSEEQAKFATEERNITNKLNSIQSEFSKIDEKLKTASESEKEFLVKFITLLNEKKQTLLSQLESLKEIVTTIEQNIKNLKIIITYKETPKEAKQSSSYSWKEFQEASKDLYTKKTELTSLQDKIKTLEKQQETELKFLESNNLQKQTQEDKLKQVEEEIGKGIREQIKINERALLKEEIILLSEIDISYKLKIKKLKELVILKNSDLQILTLEIEKKSEEIKEIEKNLIPTAEDVNIAQQEWSLESQKSQIAKDSWEEKKNPIKKEIEELKKKIDSLNSDLSKTKDQAEQIYQESLLLKYQTEIDKHNNYLKIIDYEKSRLDLNVTAKKLQHDSIKAYYQSNLENSLIKPWLESFKNQKDIILVQITELDRKINEEINTQTETIRKIDQVKAKIEELQLKKTGLFRNKTKFFEDSIINYNDAKINLITIKDSRAFAIINDQKNTAEEIKNTIDFTKKQLQTKNISENIWKRSPKSITLSDLLKAIKDAESFLIKLFWDTQSYLNPYIIVTNIKNLNLPNYFGLLIFAIFFILFMFFTKKILLLIQNIVSENIKISKHNQNIVYLLISISTFLEFSLNNFKLLFSWFFIYCHILFDFRYIFSSIEFLATPYLIAVFYIATIPIWIYLSGKLLATAKMLNEKLSYLFFAEKTESKFIFLVASILYSTATLIPLRQAFLNYIDMPSSFPNVMSAAYSLILVVMILLFFGKEDVLTLIPSQGPIFSWLTKKIEKYYYPVFISFMGLLILSNPYIGYSNMAWYLAFAIPVSMSIIYGALIAHSYIRKWSSTFFLKEENDEIVNKFEQAKVYYGFFIILTFLALSFIAFFFITRIWQLNYTVASLFSDLSKRWVIPISPTANLGILELITLISFIISGFIISYLVKTFVLTKLFEIFRTEPGAQNTMFKISHYIIIALAIILGFITIQLREFITIAGSFLAIGIGFALKDLASDYVAGLFILIERPVEIGNYIQLDEHTIGTVQKISARATTIRTARNFSIIVPNKDLVSKQIINWGDGRISVGFELRVSVDYNQNLERVKEILHKTIQSHDAILKVPTTVIRIEDFGDSGVNFFIRAFISARRVREQWDISSDLRFAIMKVFKENNITIPFPQIVVHRTDEKAINSIK